MAAAGAADPDVNRVPALFRSHEPDDLRQDSAGRDQRLELRAREAQAARAQHSVDSLADLGVS